jgi:hypothetical protein
MFLRMRRKAEHLLMGSSGKGYVSGSGRDEDAALECNESAEAKS